MTDFQFRLNPPVRELVRCSGVLRGVARHYRVEQYRTTMSLKSVRSGAALYVTRQGRHLVTGDTFLILNQGQEYSLEFQGAGATETLCPFFQRGFLEHVADSLAAPVPRQLDEIAPRCPQTDFYERLYPNCGRVASLLHRLHRRVGTRTAHGPWLEDWFYALAAALVELRDGVRDEVDRFPGHRAATRAELYRRLHRGRDFLSSCYDEPVTVALAAKAANLSPYHFHHTFKLAFNQTPMRFLQDCRLRAARKLLVETDQPVTTIALGVGFESPSAFSWLFRKRFGLCPRQFRGQSVRRANSQD
jgi:AraC-like DNA-binding protein